MQLSRSFDDAFNIRLISNDCHVHAPLAQCCHIRGPGGLSAEPLTPGWVPHRGTMKTASWWWPCTFLVSYWTNQPSSMSKHWSISPSLKFIVGRLNLIRDCLHIHVMSRDSQNHGDAGTTRAARKCSSTRSAMCMLRRSSR